MPKNPETIAKIIQGRKPIRMLGSIIISFTHFNSLRIYSPAFSTFSRILKANFFKSSALAILAVSHYVFPYSHLNDSAVSFSASIMLLATEFFVPFFFTCATSTFILDLIRDSILSLSVMVHYRFYGEGKVEVNPKPFMHTR